MTDVEVMCAARVVAEKYRDASYLDVTHDLWKTIAAELAWAERSIAKREQSNQGNSHD